MEYVEGERILDFCGSRHLGLTERLSLFVGVCEAIQHAHQNLIIHRDIKSSNIIVDAAGRPKLLDFGIAKLLQEDDKTRAVTQEGGRFLTPRMRALNRSKANRSVQPRMCMGSGYCSMNCWLVCPPTA